MGAYQGPQSDAGAAYVSLTRKPATNISVDDVPAPTELYVTDDSRLRLTCFTQIANVQLLIAYKLLRSVDGQATIFEQQVSLQSAGVVSNFDFNLTEGFLLSVTVIPLSGPVLRGQVYAVGQILRGSPNDVKVVRVLFSDYTVGNQAMGFPNGRIDQSVNEHGAQSTFAFGPASLGTEVNIGPQPLQRLELRSVNITFVTSAAVANRTPEFRLLNGTGIYARIPYPGNIAASQTIGITLMTGGPQPILNNGVALLPLPTPCIFRGIDQLVTVTGNLQAGDQYTVQNIDGESWVEG